MSALSDALVVHGYRVGWAAVRRMPARTAYALFDLLARRVLTRNGRDVQRLRANYARVRPELGPAELEELVRTGVRSYMRYFCEAFRLPSMDDATVDASVRAVGDGPIHRYVADGRSVVCFLGHMGNWDLAGAWGTRHVGPIVTVAERLKPEQLYAEFVAFREQIGLTILPLTGAGDPFPRLVEHLLGGPGRPVVMPLLADRDLTRRGVTVDFCGHRARMAAGPAALALRTGAPLIPISVHYEPRERGLWRIVVTFHDAVDVPTGGTARDRATAMTQQCADALGTAVREHTQDWHMMQRVFVDDGAGEDAGTGGIHATDGGRG